MFRLWGKIIKNNRITTDKIFELEAFDLNINEKIDQGLEALCYHFDIQKPLWFKDNNTDFELVGKTRFTDHHFIETIDFDYFEIEIIENEIENT